METLITRLRSLIIASAIMAMTAAGAYMVEPLSFMTSAPEVMVWWMILSICSLLSNVVIGMPVTHEYSVSGTMVSPCSPMTNACVSSRETSSSCAMYVRKRRVSRMLPIPNTRFVGKPDVLRAM